MQRQTRVQLRSRRPKHPPFAPLASRNLLSILPDDIVVVLCGIAAAVKDGDLIFVGVVAKHQWKIPPNTWSGQQENVLA